MTAITGEISFAASMMTRKVTSQGNCISSSKEALGMGIVRSSLFVTGEEKVDLVPETGQETAFGDCLTGYERIGGKVFVI